MMHISETALPGVMLLEPRIFKDDRGFFFESYHEKRAWDAGLQVKFVQDNQSFSRQGTLRGLHYQLKHPQGKLVRVVTGEVFDVAVDIRQGSPTFGQWYGEYLSANNHHQLYVPPGFGHGFCVISETADFLYKCTDFYTASPILSAKDAIAPFLKDATHQLPIYQS
jgi:dTDP-4-dehydrorhamnose 3,5-epimerase